MWANRYPLIIETLDGRARGVTLTMLGISLDAALRDSFGVGGSSFGVVGHRHPVHIHNPLSAYPVQGEFGSPQRVHWTGKIFSVFWQASQTQRLVLWSR